MLYKNKPEIFKYIVYNTQISTNIVSVRVIEQKLNQITSHGAYLLRVQVFQNKYCQISYIRW